MGATASLISDSFSSIAALTLSRFLPLAVLSLACKVTNSPRKPTTSPVTLVPGRPKPSSRRCSFSRFCFALSSMDLSNAASWTRIFVLACAIWRSNCAWGVFSYLRSMLERIARSVLMFASLILLARAWRSSISAKRSFSSLLTTLICLSSSYLASV